MGSTNGRFLLGLLLGLLCGGGLAYWLGGSGPAKTEDLGVLVPGEDSATLSGSREELGLSAPTMSADVSRPVPASAHVGDGEVRAFVSNLGDLRVAQQSGSGVIHGRVTDEDGVGLTGVVVRVTRASERYSGTPASSVGSAAPVDAGIEQAVRDAALRYKQGRAALREVVTGEGGTYRFDTLEDSEWSAQAYLQGYRIRVDGSPSRVRIGTQIDFTAVPVIEVPIQIFSPSGGVPDVATVNVQRRGTDDQPFQSRWTEEEAFVRLEPGTYELVAYAGGMNALRDAEYISEPQEVVVEKDVAPAALRFDLRGRLGIRGFVKTAKEDPKIDHVTVRLMPLSPQQEPDLTVLAGADETAWATPSQEFSFMDLEPGRYLVGATRSWASPITAHRVVEVSNDMARCDLELPPIDRSQLLRITVAGPDGEALDEVEFSLQTRSANGSTRSGAYPIRDDDGAYLLQFKGKNRGIYFDGKDPSATFVLTVTHEDYGQRRVELDLGQTELPVTFGDPGTLHVTVAGYQGSTYEGRLSISVQKSGEGSPNYSTGNRGRLSTEGEQEISGLEPGSYTISLNASPEGSSPRRFGSKRIDSVDVEILPGPNAVILGIPTLYSIRVHWADGKPGANMSMRPPSGENPSSSETASATLDDNGFAEFTELPAGDYLLTTWGVGVQQMLVTVPGEDVEYVPMQVKALRVTISDETGDLAKLGFRNDDLIIGANGKEFEESPDYRLMRDLQTSKSAKVSFIIERNGERLEITASGADIGDWSDLGGQLVPTQR